VTVNPMTHDEYLTAAAAFVTQLLQGIWPDEVKDWHQVVGTVTCHTPGCTAQGVGREGALHTNVGGVAAGCGACGYPTRIEAEFTDGVYEIVNTAPAPNLPQPGDGEEEPPVEDIEEEDPGVVLS